MSTGFMSDLDADMDSSLSGRVWIGKFYQFKDLLYLLYNIVYMVEFKFKFCIYLKVTTNLWLDDYYFFLSSF